MPLAQSVADKIGNDPTRFPKDEISSASLIGTSCMIDGESVFHGSEQSVV
jgi:hypothetical protein